MDADRRLEAVPGQMLRKGRKLVCISESVNKQLSISSFKRADPA